MRPYIALVKREFLEHRGAFLIAPAVITLLVILVFASAIIFGRHDIQTEITIMGSRTNLFNAFYGASIALWLFYLMIALFFYFAESFSADRKNNGLLFWKSMPQSDLKILSSKILAGGTVFPMAIGAWILISGILAYLFSIWIASVAPILQTIDPLTFLNNFVQMSVVAAIFTVLALLWYAPFFAWVALLSTVFKRWSIPLAFVIPGLMILAERIFRFSNGYQESYIANFIAFRMENMFSDDAIVESLVAQKAFNGATIVIAMLNQMNWMHLFIGLVVTAGFVYAASEYRRRKIEA